ncbi:DUF4279 domain-containing protein [Hamadaea tsunoensis]|uniref:DUF4279 domain-containing protein n=1 Tax=Hamadaea tsunoensis TaxID=53368 RepID=UPI000401D768|nr:DUF4279 domain-containing protein [Hamadaea tsunoensis]
MTDETPLCRQRAYLYVARDIELAGAVPDEHEQILMDFDPAEVTRLTGLDPTAAVRRGEPGRRGPRRFSTWKLELPEQDTFYTEDVVLPLLDLVEPHADRLQATREQLGLSAGIMVVIHMRGVRDPDGGLVVSTAAVGYSQATVRRLTALDLSIDHDQYVSLPDD